MFQKILRGTVSMLLALAFALAAVIPAQAAPPTNDDFANATVISTIPFDDTVDSTDATVEAGEPTPSCAGYGSISRSVWYAFIPAADGTVLASIPTADFTPVLAVFTGSSLSSLSELGCKRDAGGSIIFYINAGTTYYFQVSTPIPWDTGGSKQFHLEVVPPPANDHFADATIISTLPFDDALDTAAATVEAGEPTTSCGGYYPMSRTVWYAFTPATGGSFSASVPDAAFYPVFAVFTGSSLTGLTELGCQNNSYYSLIFHANAGTTYYFQVSYYYYWQMGGSMQFHLDVAPLPVAGFSYNPYDPSIYDTVQFYDGSYDPANVGIQSWAWNFGDGATGSGAQPAHLYQADGDYTVGLTVTTSDGRTASASQVVQVRTHDVAITKITAPLTAKAGQVQKITIAVKSQRYNENVQVDLYKSVLGGTQWVGAITQNVPVRKGNQTTPFTFNYTFTGDDVQLGKVSFKAVATIVGSRDALPADNELISSPPTKVSR